MVIYKITNKINGKVYVGQTTKNPEKRWKRHISTESNKRPSEIHKAIVEYGVENFNFEVLEKTENKHELDIAELKYIKEFNTLVPDGYNLRSGGSSSNHHEETRRKISKASKGRIVSEETKKKASESHKRRSIVCNETGQIFQSIKEASEAFKIDSENICVNIRGKSKTVNGFSFKRL